MFFLLRIFWCFTDQLSSTYDIEKLRIDYKSIRHDVNRIKNDVSAIKDLLTEVLENVPGITHLTFHDKYPLDIPFKTVPAFRDFDAKLSDDKELRKEFVSFGESNSWWTKRVVVCILNKNLFFQIQSLQMAINSSESLSKIIVNILKKWLSKDVAMEFTAVKVIGEKIVMKDTRFCKCLLSKSSFFRFLKHQLISRYFPWIITLLFNNIFHFLFQWDDIRFFLILAEAFEIKMAADPKMAVLSEKTFFEKLGAVLGNARDWEGRKTAERSQKNKNTETT